MEKPNINSLVQLVLLIILFSCHQKEEIPADIPPNPVLPSDQQIAYQQMELIGFIHFTMNTFTNKEWGYGDEEPKIFNPTALNVEQWVEVAKAAGMKELILTAKHHDGFCLWPSKYTEHSVKNSPYKEGNGDIVREFVEACEKHGLKAGLYLSPWDRNHKDYGSPDYIEYYRNQLEELLTSYGEINEIWFDGANGGDGYYGGANETRKIDSKSYYGWQEIFSLVKTWQPNIKIFSDAGPDVHWIGNERGYAGSTFWSTICPDSLIIGNSKTAYLNSGDPQGGQWTIGQCDVSIRPGWFYHLSEDSLVKTPQELMDIYYKSVGRNAILLLNLPPDRRGLIHENDVKALMGFKELREQTFANDLTYNANVTANNYRFQHEKFAPQNILLENGDYWATDDKVFPAELIIELEDAKLFDRILIQEPIRFGQRISRFELDILRNGQWETIFKGTTIGYKRLIPVETFQTSEIRLRILEANNSVAISRFALYKSNENGQQVSFEY